MRIPAARVDAGETYDRFIALKYSYAIAEDTAREGYTLHGNHSDDLSIEVITTDASENGANASFAGIYSYEIRVNDGAAAEAARTVRKVRTQAEAGWLMRRARTGGIRDHGIRSSTAQKRETVLLAENLPGIFPGGDRGRGFD